MGYRPNFDDCGIPSKSDQQNYLCAKPKGLIEVNMEMKENSTIHLAPVVQDDAQRGSSEVAMRLNDVSVAFSGKTVVRGATFDTSIARLRLDSSTCKTVFNVVIFHTAGSLGALISAAHMLP